MKIIKRFLAKHNNSDPKVSAHKSAEYPINEQLREARIGLIAIRNYWLDRNNNGDPLFDQWMVDAQDAAIEALKALDKLEDSMGINQDQRKEVNSLLITRMKSSFAYPSDEPAEDQGY